LERLSGRFVSIGTMIAARLERKSLLNIFRRPHLISREPRKDFNKMAFIERRQSGSLPYLLHLNPSGESCTAKFGAPRSSQSVHRALDFRQAQHRVGRRTPSDCEDGLRFAKAVGVRPIIKKLVLEMAAEGYAPMMSGAVSTALCLRSQNCFSPFMGKGGNIPICPSQTAQSAHREDDGEDRGHAKQEEDFVVCSG
jgi:hypothetical protein